MTLSCAEIRRCAALPGCVVNLSLSESAAEDAGRGPTVARQGGSAGPLPLLIGDELGLGQPVHHGQVVARREPQREVHHLLRPCVAVFPAETETAGSIQEGEVGDGAFQLGGVTSGCPGPNGR